MDINSIRHYHDPHRHRPNPMTTILQLLKSRTVWFALLLAVLSIVQGYVALLPITPVQQMFVGCGIAVAITLLRIITTQPIADK